MPSMAYVDGEVGPRAAARVPVTDRGLRWGDHVFEIVRAIAGHPCDGAAHLERLAASAALVRIPPLPPGACARALADTLDAAALADADVRIMVTRGDDRDLAPSVDARPRLVITVEPSRPARHAGVRLLSLDAHRGGLVPATAKTGNYLGSVLAVAAARDAGADDALLHDGEQVLETATASLLVVHGGEVYLPLGPRLPGVTSARVAALLADRGVPSRAAVVDRAMVAAADELLVTSARRGVAPVIAVDGVARVAGPVGQLASAAYTAWLDAHRDLKRS